MGALPKKKISLARRGKRREKIKYSAPKLVPCQNCKTKILPHSVCPNCGMYKGRVVNPPKVKTKVTKVDKDEVK